MKQKQQVLILLVATILISLIIIFIDNTFISTFDSRIYEEIAKYINPSMTIVMKIITNAGGTISLLLLVLVLLAFKKTRKKWGLPVACSLVISVAINTIIKLAIARERPDILRMVETFDSSFPSGHAMNNMAYYSMILMLTWTYIKNIKIKWSLSIVCVIMPLIIGISRIYLGVHYATDIIAGWIIGFVISYFVYYLFNKRKEAHEKSC